jgi:DNA modification methylase
VNTSSAKNGLAVTYRPIDTLVPYARNARTHSDAQVAQIAGSIREFGWTNPVLIDEEGGLIAGHGRVLAARKLGMAEVPAITIAGLTKSQKRALVIADNKLALNAGWDDELLRLELAELRDDGFELGLTGFGPEELGELLADRSLGLTDPDEAPEPPVQPVSQLGDVWLLGRHRLVCGDCTDAQVVDKALGGVRPHLMVTDPPYGVDYDPEWRTGIGKSAEGKTVRVASGKALYAYKVAGVGKVVNDDIIDWREAWALFPGDVAYVWHAGTAAGIVGDSLAACGLAIRAQIVWAKGRFAIGRGNYHWQHEPCWYAVKEGKKAHWAGDRSQTTLWPIQHNKSDTGHGTQKPVECMKRPIENNSSPGQAVYDPFVGSGTTIIAAEMTGRACHAIELNPQYIDVCVQRWQNFTGKQATLEGDGRTFDEVARERAETRPGAATLSAVA